VSDRLLIPERLYGREREIGALLAAFNRVLSHGTPELVLVSGYSGVGKSSVVNELHKVLVPLRGLFASGKFDQYKRDIPYATLAQAFQTLIRQILVKSETEAEQWRGAIQEAVGPNGQLIVDLIPEVEIIIGKQPSVPDLPPRDAQNRFQMVLRRFLGTFARPEHPLALFLDDLQWMDAASLELLEYLVTYSDVRHLLLVGAYRDNEVGAAHPLMQTLEAIRKAGTRVEEIALPPLGLGDIGALVSDALHCTPEHAHSLAQLAHEKTAGNPFFAIQFLTALAEEGLVRHDPDSGAWVWELARIRAHGYTDNVVDLMVERLKRLSPAGQTALQQLACLGNVSETASLSLVFGESEETIHASLLEAVRAGLIFRMESSYAFLHDRIQEAAYSLIPEGDRAGAHLRIGRVLWTTMSEDQLAEYLFDVANQLNRGAALLVDLASMFEEIVGTSPSLRAVLSRVSKVAPTDSTVLITGETGTGKELIARAVHRRSDRSSRPFVSVNCAAIPRDLLASELFGHEKGAFTGAIQRRIGRFELAEGGTLFLDEIGELPAETQIALLRVLQEREFERVGGIGSIRTNVRVIAATNRDLQAAIAAGTFRSDLFYRLNVFPIEVPPLRERREDIPVLVGYFIDRFARKAGKSIRSVDKMTMESLQSYPWPGNIRELQNIIERSVIVCDTENFSVDESWLSRPPLASEPNGRPELSRKLANKEIEMIEAALRESGGRVSGPSGAAVRLGIPGSTLDSKIRSLRIDKNRFKST